MKRFAPLTLAVIVAGAIVAIALPSISGSGSPWLARRWVKRFENIESISEAADKYSVASRDFGDGTWIFGVSVGSHGNPFGGTVVTKDSTGHTRVFFGHVCTESRLAYTLSKCSSLEETYTKVTANGVFREQDPH